MRRTLTVAAIAVLVFCRDRQAGRSAKQGRCRHGYLDTTNDIDLRPAHRISRDEHAAGYGNTAALAGYGISGQPAVLHNGRCSAATQPA